MNAICIECPMGCMLEIVESEGQIKVTGNNCRRGIDYGKQEYTAPKRIITTLVETENGGVLPVRTSCPVDKTRIKDVLMSLKGLRVKEPAHLGEVVVKDICGTGADLISAARVIS